MKQLYPPGRGSLPLASINLNCISKFFAALLFLLLSLNQSALAQCPSPNAFQLEHPGSGAAGITPATLNKPVYAMGTWAGHFVRVHVEEGRKYNFSLIGSEDTLRDHFKFPDGIVPNITFLRPEVDHDPIMTIYDNTGSTAGFALSGNVLAFNEDASATEIMPELDFTATYTGELLVAIDLQPGTVAYNPGTGPPNVIHASAPADCGQLFQDSTALRVTWIPRGPALLSATKDSETQITATFDTNVQTKGGNPTDFTVVDGMGTDFPVSAQADGTAGDSDIVLTVAELSSAIGDLTVTYTDNNGEISDATDVTALASSGSVTIDLDTGPPILVSATYDSETQITLTFSEPVKTGGGNPTDFTVKDAANTAFNVTAQADGTALDNQIVLTTDDLSAAQLNLTITYTNNNNEISDFGSNNLATDATGVSLSIFTLSNVTGPFYWEYQGGGPSLPAGPNPAGLDVAVLPITPQRQGSVAFGDLDGDGDVDFISGGNRGSLYYFQNTGTATSPNWERKAGVINSLDTIKIGKLQNTNEVMPTLHDFDSDGDLDLIVGSRWNYSGNNKWEDVYVFINGGTATNPVFDPVILDNRYGIGEPNGAERYFFRELPVPAFVDIDGDNDSDLLIAGSDSITYLKNVGTATAPMYEWQEDNNNPLRPVSRGGTVNEPDFLYPGLQFADFDNDGDFDMYFTSEDGFVEVFENTGTATNPVFTNSMKLGEPFGSTSHGAFGKLSFADVNNDGIIDIMTTHWNPSEWFWYAGRTTVVNPILTSVTKDSDTQITVTFDQNVQTNGGNPTDFTVVDGQGTNFTVTAQVDGTAGDTDIVLTVADFSAAVGDLTVTYTNNNNEISDATSGVNFAETGTKSIDLDTTPPTLVSATKDSDTQITMTLNEPVQTNGTNPADFAVTDGIGTNFTVSAQADGTANDTDIVLTVNDMSGAVGDLKVTYTNNNNEITDFGENSLATDANGVMIDTDLTAPTLVSATKDSDTQITVTLSEPVQTNGTNPNDFTITDGVGTGFTVTAQADGTAKDTDIVLTINDLSTAVGDLTVTYTDNNSEVSDFGGNGLDTDGTGVLINSDAIAPTVVSASKDSDTQITVTFSEPVQIPDGDTPFANFILKDGLGTTYAASAVADGTANDNQLVVTVADLSEAVGDLTLTYDSSQDEGTILDFGANVVADNLAGVVIDTDTTNPTMVSGVRDSDTQITLTFSEPVQTNEGNPTDFTVVDAENTPFAVSAQADGTANDTEIVLTVADFSGATGPLTVTYTNSNNEVSDFGGNDLATDATGVEVALNAVVTAVSVPSDDSYMAGEELSFTVTFDRVVTVTGTPRLPLTIGATNVNATLSGTVSNATEATFVYLVQAGEEDTDGIALGTGIDLNGATIQDADNLDAILDLNNIASTTQVLVDAIAPAAPVIVSITDDTGDSDSDQITNDQSLVVKGTAEANSSLSLLVDGEAIFGGVIISVDGDGNWEFDPVGEGTFTLDEGDHTYTATTTDAAGNESEISAGFDVTVDLTAPEAPTLDFDASTDLGISDSDNLTSADNGLSYSGTAEPNSTVYLLFVDENDNPVEESGTSEPIAVDGDGNWSYQVNEAPAFTVIPLAAIAIDAAGNTSPQSATVTVTIDTELAISSTSPADDETDVLPNANLTITFDKNVVRGTGNIQIIQSSDDQVQQTIDVTGDNVTIDGATVTIDPAANILPPDTEFYVNIDEGAFENEAGAAFAGLSDKTTWSFTIIAASVVSSVEVPADDYYAAGSNLDFTVNMVLPVSVSGGVPSIPVTIGEQVVNATLVGTVTTSDALTFRYTVEEGQEDIDGIALGSAIELNGATMQDEFTVDAILTLNSVRGTSGVLVDAIDPVAPVIVSITDDTGSASDDRITNDQSLVIRGTAEANSSLSLLVDGEAIFGGVIISVDGDGNWEFDPVGEGTFTLDEGAHTYTATTKDAAGNESEVSADFDVTVDLTAPEASAVDLSPSSDSGISDTDDITNDLTPTVQGVSEANAPIEILVDGSSVGNTTADASGDWSFTITTDWGDGVYDITAKATDIAGNTSEEGSALSLTIDTTVPTNVLFPPIEGDDIINNSEKTDVVVTGGTSGVADGLEVTVTFTDGVNTPVEATATVMADEWATGEVDISSLADGAIQITADVTDAAGNDAETMVADLILDTTAPEAPSVISISDDSGSASDDALTNDQTLTFMGMAEANSSVEVFIDGTSVGTTSADDSGNWTFDHTGTTLTEANYGITAKATDEAGNTSAESAALNIIIDTTAPVAPTTDLIAESDLGVSDTDDLTSEITPTVEGTAEANSTVEIFVDNSAVGTATADASGNWSFTIITDWADGTYSITATATDAAGNTSDAGTALDITLDTSLSVDITSPTDNEVDVLPNANLTITFDKGVVKGSGNITIKQVNDDTIIETIDVAGSNVTVSGATVAIDPVDNILPPDTEFYVTIDAGAFENEAGAPFAGISDNSTWSFTIIAASVVSSVDVPADGTYMIGDNLDFTVNMILPVSISGTATIPVTIGSTTVNATQVGTVSNTNSILFRYTVVEDELDADGIAVGSAMNLNGGTMRDEFGVDAILTLNGVSSTAAVLVDGVKPSPSISSDAVALVNGTFSATITYDEAVENVLVEDLTVTNGTASNLQSITAGTSWTVDITPTADGMVDVSLAAGTANDLAGNGSKASNTISRDFDGTAPVVMSLNRTGNDPVNTGIAEVGYRLIFSEEVTGVDLTDLEIVLTGTATGALSTVMLVDARTYDITIDGVGGQGTIGVNVKTDDTITDAATNPLGGAFIGQVYTTNFIPTDITLSVENTDENNGLTDELATISTTDADAGDSHTYSLVSGTGDEDNGSFTVDGTSLRANSLSFNFEDRASYSLRLRTDDGKGGIYEEAFTFTVNDVNEVPAMLSLSNTDIDESDNAQTVGDFSTLDQDGGDSFTYTLVSGMGDTDNSAFTISGNTLSTAGLINFEDGATRSILVRVTDSGGLSIDRQFTINIGEVVIEPLREYETNIPGGAVRNIFSPNGDGVNETWVIEDLLDNPVNEVKVYAQGGKLIFSKVNYRNDWDGTFKGDPIPDGTYYYEINVYEGERIIKGFLTIIRNR